MKLSLILPVALSQKIANHLINHGLNSDQASAIAKLIKAIETPDQWLRKHYRDDEEESSY